MKVASQLKDLEQFGIKPLTGEADALVFRILCDLDEQGVRVFKECFGIPFAKTDPVYGLNDNWNSGSIASVMLTGHDVVPLAIMGFYLQGHNVLLCRDRRGFEMVFALDPGEEVALNNSGDGYDLIHSGEVDGQPWPVLSYGEIIRIIRQRKSDGQRVVGTRNVHQMSGRVS